jgi:hypothetical protein
MRLCCISEQGWVSVGDSGAHGTVVRYRPAPVPPSHPQQSDANQTRHQDELEIGIILCKLLPLLVGSQLRHSQP